MAAAILSDIDLKTCKICLASKPASEFEKARSCIDGRRGACKKCLAPQTAKRAAAWRARHPERAKEADERYKLANPDKLRETRAKHYQKNAEQYREIARQYYAANTEYCKAANRDWMRLNKERRAKSSAAWRAANKAHVSMSYARWEAANPDARRAINQNRRARLNGNGGTLSRDIRSRLHKLQRGKCACCGQPLGKNYHMDHIMPIALGGRNDDSNMQLLRATCNLSKKAKHPVDYMREKGFLI